MTSTMKGLQELASRAGYEHFDSIALRSSVVQGCAFCHVLLTHHDYFYSGRPYLLPARIWIRAQSITDLVEVQATATEHPFQVLRETKLVVSYHVNMDYQQDTQMLYELFTVAGESVL